MLSTRENSGIVSASGGLAVPLRKAADPDSVTVIGSRTDSAPRSLANGASRAEELRARAQAARERAAALAARSSQARQIMAQARAAIPAAEILRFSPYARLRARLETMPVIEQAKGIIMAQSRCGADEAFDMLRQASQRSNRPVRDLAAAIVARQRRLSARPEHLAR